ncbi:MAG: amidohydrolase family protein [Bacteroidota bacterium]
MKPNLLIRHGKLYTGAKDEEARIAHIYIQEGKISQISENEIEVPEGTQILDASGKWITPGFIDSHTHYDAEVIASPGLKESARHGVTSIILGSCSVSAIYNSPEETSDCFTRVEAIPRDVMLPLLEERKNWDSPKSWKAFLDTLPLGINVASFLGHSDLRVKAMGIERSLMDNEKATRQEQAEMDRLLNEALDEGFLGLSTMDNPWDKMDGEKYWSHKTPSFYASWKERKDLLKTLRKRDGILQGAPNLVTRVNALQYMGVSTGIFRKPIKTTMIAMMDLIADRWISPMVGFASKIINSFMGADFRMQYPPVPFTVYYDGVDSVMFEEFPSGEAMRHLAKNLDERNDLIRDPAFRKAFKKEIAKKFAPKVWHRDLSMAVILECPDPSLIGKNFYQIAEEQGQHPVETFLDLIIDYDKQIRWTTTLANDRKEKYKELYNFEHLLISFSDAGAHLNNMAFYDFPLKMMRNVQESIEKGSPLMSMEKCVWRLTGEQADWFGLECGHIKEGSIADLVIIDPQQFSSITEEVHDEPIKEFDGFVRLVNRNEGVVSQVVVGGEVICENGNFVEGYGTEKKFGRFLPAQHVKPVSALANKTSREREAHESNPQPHPVASQ